MGTVTSVVVARDRPHRWLIKLSTFVAAAVARHDTPTLFSQARLCSNELIEFGPRGVFEGNVE
jgi:hypothetical protein